MRLDHPTLPPPVSRPWIAVAVAVWALAALVAEEKTPDPLSRGRHQMEGVLTGDVVDGRFGPWVIVETGGSRLLLDLPSDPGLAAGDRVRFEGIADGVSAMARGQWHSSVLKVTDIEKLGGPESAVVAAGNLVRDHVMERLRPFDDGRALLAGFLIGDVTELDLSDVEAMRLSGLSHFVAVSGSNVAMFLVLLSVAAGPLALGPRRRAVIGLLGLPVYVAATRFEPSVLRASLMAGLALVGRLVGVVLEAWQLLALAVIVLLALDPDLTGNVGFQLSVAATAGVLVGARWPVPGGKVQKALMVTVGAQLAVAPLLVVHFGSIPLLSPVANLVAAPLVAGSTMLGAIGVVGPSLLVDISSWMAGLVLSLARGASSWPQLTAGPVIGLGLAGLVAARWKPVRTVVVAVGALVVAVGVIGPPRELPEVGAVVLDVGQGDAILLHGGQGRFALVDGGPDPVVLRSRLRSYGVTALELVVLTHVHADHVAGLVGLVGEVVIGEAWMALDPHETTTSREFVSLLEQLAVSNRAPQVGEIHHIGSLAVEVVAPRRRYASPNDQSIVVLVHGPTQTMLLSGDIEVIAQRELTGLRADVLKVPHQGAATTDPEWLESVGATLAVISVGPNQFGHPADWVIDLLEQSGATVHRTDEDGDIPVDLGRPPTSGSEARIWAIASQVRSSRQVPTEVERI